MNTSAGKRWQLKKLGIEKTIELANKLNEELKAKIILFGGKEEVINVSWWTRLILFIKNFWNRRIKPKPFGSYNSVKFYESNKNGKYK